jgi:hypothetical protein
MQYNPYTFIIINRQGDYTMNIVKRLSINNNFSAVLLQDGTEEYPVFLSSLHNTVLLDQLLSEGWQLCGLPYDLRKDGVKLSALPIEEFHPTVEEEQDMYDSVGTPLSMDDLKSKITVAAIEYLEMPSAEYTIFTREDFLKYLTIWQEINLETDFLPINYFVHPNALFNEDEYLSGQYADFISIMERRRFMSYTKFNSLIAWAMTKGLQENFTVIDLLDLYFSWGIDGLNMPIVTKRREQRYSILDPGNVQLEKLSQQYIYRVEIGLVDKYGTILVPEESKKFKWEPRVTNQQIFEQSYRGLKEDETIRVDVTCRTSEESTVLEGLKINVVYDQNVLLVGGLRFSTIAVFPNDASKRAIPNQYWNPSAYQRLRTVCYLRALSQEAISRCIKKSNATSIKALTLSGCSPASALIYYVKNADLDVEKNKQNLDDDESMPLITLFDVDAYLEGKMKDEEKKSVLDSFLNGVASIDNVYNGIMAELEYSADTIYTELYAIHFVLGVPLDEIYSKINQLDETQEAIEFAGNGYTYTLKLPRLQMRINGYNLDLEDYRDRSLDTAMEYTYVTCVAKEMGNKEVQRHVALECFTLSRSPRVNMLLEKLCVLFKTTVESNVIGIQNQARWLKLTNLFAAQKYFEIALQGKITIPQGIKNEIIDVTASERAEYRNTLESNIESTVVYCDTNVENDGNFRRYCVNAYITPEYVIPKTGYTIPESNFLVLWRDFSSTPALKAQLVERGLITNDFIPWENRYYFDKLCLNDMSSNKTLEFYHENAEQYRKNLSEYEEFKSAPHPIEYMYAALQSDEDIVVEEEQSSVKLRDAVPSYSVGTHRNITKDDFAHLLSVAEEYDSVKKPIVPFRGYDAEDFYLVQDVIKLSMPGSTKHIQVYLPNKIYTKETGMVDFTYLSKLCEQGGYNILNIRGRKYIFDDIRGKRWEVTI